MEAVAADDIPGETQISVAVVDDATIARLNEQFLQHEGPTDVLSFVLEQAEGRLEGEVVVSAETARRGPVSGGRGEELLLYVIHGMLHLAGYDDATPAEKGVMRRREAEVLARLGVQARYDESTGLGVKKGKGS